MTYHNYISLYLFFIFVFYLFLEIESFTPTGRLAHYSVLVGNKLYFFGGEKTFNDCTNEVFYLDVSQPFNIATPPWIDRTVNEGIPIKSCWGTASLIDINNEQSIYLFSGLQPNATENVPLVHKLNLKSGKWEIPIIKGKLPERRIEITAVNDNSGKFYIFGGHFSSSPAAGEKFFNDMIILNVAELSWSISYLFDAPTQLAGYSATLLSNGVIVYIGGFSFINVLQVTDITQIRFYDTNSFKWSVQKANLISQIDDRCSHSAILAPDGKIIIYGGSKTIDNFQVTPNLAVLNTNTNPFEWTVPPVSSNIGVVPSLVSHTANLVGNYMIVAFGNITRPNAIPTSASANIYIMDIGSYTWVNTFDPSTPSSIPIPTTTNTSNTTENQPDQLIMKIVIGILSGIIGTAILVIIGIFGYKRYQRNQKEKENDIMRIYGNN